jgi:hypothetical protein
VEGKPLEMGRRKTGESGTGGYAFHCVISPGKDTNGRSVDREMEADDQRRHSMPTILINIFTCELRIVNISE